jgi:hypothetical protein
MVEAVKHPSMHPTSTLYNHTDSVPVKRMHVIPVLLSASGIAQSTTKTESTAACPSLSTTDIAFASFPPPAHLYRNSRASTLRCSCLPSREMKTTTKTMTTWSPPPPPPPTMTSSSSRPPSPPVVLGDAYSQRRSHCSSRTWLMMSPFSLGIDDNPFPLLLPLGGAHAHLSCPTPAHDDDTMADVGLQ